MNGLNFGIVSKLKVSSGQHSDMYLSNTLHKPKGPADCLWITSHSRLRGIGFHVLGKEYISQWLTPP